MQKTTDCLSQAMFIASESYSGSFYDLNLSQAMNQECDDMSAIASLNDQATITAMAA